MAIVYKYYPPTDYTFDALENGYFFFSKAAKLNDPFDCSFKLITGFDLTQELIRRGWIPAESEDIINEYATCSFSQKKDSKHMWTFYAENYSGILVGFDEERFEELPDKYSTRILYYNVQYIDSMLNFDCPCTEFKTNLVFDDIRTYKISDLNDKTLDAFFEYLCTIKEKKTWQEEVEKRLIVASEFIRNKNKLTEKGVEFLDNGYKIPMPDNCIKEIYVGHNITTENLGKVREIAKKHNVQTIRETTFGEPFDVKFKEI